MTDANDTLKLWTNDTIDTGLFYSIECNPTHKSIWLQGNATTVSCKYARQYVNLELDNENGCLTGKTRDGEITIIITLVLPTT